MLCGKTIPSTSDRCVDCQLAVRREQFRKKAARRPRLDAEGTDELLAGIDAAEPPPAIEDEPTSWHAEATKPKPRPADDRFESVWDGRTSLIGERRSVQR